MTVIDHPARTSSPDPQPDSDPARPGTAGRVLLELDPRTLLENPRNPRTDLGDLAELVDNVRQVGVLEPLIVTPAEGGHMVLFGHRRRAAAIEAGLARVPCDVRVEYAGRSPEQVADMLAENLHRRDLTGLEEAAGYAQLSAFEGWTPERIASRLGRPVERVRAGVGAAGLPVVLGSKVAEGALTLEQAAAIEEFAGEGKAYQRLVKAAEYPPGLHYALAAERDKRAVTVRKEQARRELAGDNVRVIAKPKDFPWSAVAVRVTELTAPSGRLLTVKRHRSCPGHAAFLDEQGEPVFVCRHPKDWGHGTPASYRHRSKAEVQEEEEAAQARREQEQALAIADEARLSFLKEYLARKGRPPAGTLRSALRVLVGQDHLNVTLRATAGTLLSPDVEADGAAAVLAEAVERSGEQRLPYVVLAYAAAAAEANLRSRKASWQFDGAYAVLWLNTIEQLGYPLSEVEAQMRAYWSTPLEDEDLLDLDLPSAGEEPDSELAGEREFVSVADSAEPEELTEAAKVNEDAQTD